MTDRLQRLLERARARTGEFWTRRQWWNETLREYAEAPVPMARARALMNVLEHIEVSIQPDEILVGIHPASPPPPELSKKKSPAPVDAQDPYRLPAERAALRAGLFTSSNKPDHLTANYPRLLTEGVEGLLARIRQASRGCPADRAVELEAMNIAVQSFSSFIGRYAGLAEDMARDENDPRRQDELTAIADACRHLALQPPRNLREALQLVWFGFLVSCIENGESTGAFAVGRFDQYLWPFWEADRASGIPREILVEQVGCFWVKLNEFAPCGLAAAVLNMTLGGSLADGCDATNDLSFACLELMHDFRSVTPSLSVRWHARINPEFLRAAVALAAEGFGQPAFYGDPGIIRAMENAGVAPEDAVNAVPGGCVELGIQGCCHPWVGNFFNLAKCLELALFNGVDPRTGVQLGPETGSVSELDSFAKLFAAYEAQVACFLELMAHSDITTDTLAGEHSPHPFLSTIVDDCIERGVDIARGGARYNFTEVQGVGVAHVVDSLLNVRRLVYESGEISLEALLAALRRNFQGDEPLRQRLRGQRPAYGDNTAETAAMARDAVHVFFSHCEGRPNPRGGTFRPGLLVWTLHTGWAHAVGALPDGRRAGETLTSSIGPRLDLGAGSPTAVIGDVTAFEHYRCSGGLTLNLRFDPVCLHSREGLSAVISLLETYFSRGGLQLQMNVIDSALLRDAREHPGNHPGLLVRVSGFCARFGDLSPAMQDEIIARAELLSGTGGC